MGTEKGGWLLRSDDRVDWEQVKTGPTFGESGPRLEQMRTFATAPGGRLFCGVAEAGLFISDDHGLTWQPVEAFNNHPTRGVWQPGAGGMCAHRVLLAGERVWVAASAIGVLRSDDAGATFTPRNTGVEAALPCDEPGIGYCVHALVADPADPDRIWRQDIWACTGPATAGTIGSASSAACPPGFGFPIVRDDASGALFVFPLHDENRIPIDGRFAAWRSTDGGDW